MAEHAIREALVAHIEDSYLIEFGQDGITHDSDLFEAGVFDSMAMVNFAAFIEEEFNIEVTPDAIMEGDLVSVDATVKYVESSKAA